MLRTHIALTVALILAAGPAFAQHPTPDTPSPATAKLGVSGGAPLKVSPTYKLGPGDKLYIITFDEPQLTGNFVVGSDGTISLPWLGAVPASGRTESELTADIQARLKDGYILNPTVSLQVVAYRPFYILGEVNKPGQYPYTDDLSVVSAVATAGGFTYRANTKEARVKHAGQTSEVKEPISTATAVQAGDTIRIAERYF
jgi:polysaccharide export outer membrane protein